MTTKFVFFFIASAYLITSPDIRICICNSIYGRDQYNDTDMPDLYHGTHVSLMNVRTTKSFM